jgi:hypothetical protein
MRGLEHTDPFNFNEHTQTQNEQTSRPYGISVVLNEIHHMFPAFLYDTEQFRSVTDVFRYVNTQMDERYNTFNRYRNAYRQNRRPVARQPTSARTQQPSSARTINQRQRTAQPSVQQRHFRAWTEETPNVVRRSNVYPPPAPQRQTTQYPLSYVWPSASPPYNIPSDFLTNLLAAAIIQAPGTPSNFNDPVPVIPSAAHLAAGTTSTTSIIDLENPCAVCQDSMNVGNVVRHLNHCGHTFHTTCIDTWFQRNVHCPVCWHDIREQE